MVEYSRRDLICLHLDARADERGPRAGGAITATGIGDALEVGEAAADRIGLLEDLEALHEAGLVTAATRPVEGFEAPRTVYYPTEAGRDHAAAVRERVGSETVVVADGTAGEVPLSAVERYVETDTDPLVTALVRLTDDGTVPLEPDEGGFVDREEPLETVRTAVTESLEREGRAAVVRGAAGMGKTALVDEALDRVAPAVEGLAVARGACTTGPTDPYAPLRQALEGVLDAGEVLARLDRAREADTPADARQVEARRRALFDDIADALREASADRPVVVFLDNLQWADEATLALFAHLATAVTEWVYPVAFVCACRESALAAADGSLSAVLSDLEDGPGVTEVRLEALSRGDTRALLAATVGARQLPGAFVDLVHEETAGVPLLVRQTATHLVETGAVAPDAEAYPTAAGELEFPAAVGDRIERRLDNLDEASRDLVRLGAVVGDHVPGDVLAAASDLDPTTHREYVDLLVASRLWEPAGDDDDGEAGRRDLRFVSGGVREAVVDRLPPDAARRYHRRVAEALTSVRADALDEQAARVGYHFERAGDDRAVAFYRRAGAYAVDTYATGSAVANYRQAVSVGRDRDADPDELAAIAAELADVHATTGEYGAALVAVEQGLALVDAADRERCRLLGVRAAAAVARGEYDRALETARRQRKLADELDADGLRAAASEALGDVAANRSAYDEAREHYQSALAGYEAAADERGIASIQADMGDVAHSRGDYDRASEHFRRALDGFEAVGDEHGIADVHNSLGIVAEKRGSYAEAREHYERALAGFEAANDEHGLAKVNNNLGNLLRLEGEHDRASEHFRRALDGFEAVGDRHAAAMIRINLGIVARQQGAYDRAGEHYRRALDELEAVGDEHTAAKVHNYLGILAKDQGQYGRAGEHYRRALDELEAVGDEHTVADVHLHLGNIALWDGAHDRAREHYRRAEDGYERVGDRKGIADVRRYRGELALAREELDRARDLVERARETYLDLDANHDAALARRLLGRVAADEGDADAARTHLRAALDAFEATGTLPNALETLALLAETCRDVGDHGRALEWCRRADRLLDETEPDLAHHVEWVDRLRAELEDD